MTQPLLLPLNKVGGAGSRDCGGVNVSVCIRKAYQSCLAPAAAAIPRNHALSFMLYETVVRNRYQTVCLSFLRFDSGSIDEKNLHDLEE